MPRRAPEYPQVVVERFLTQGSLERSYTDAPYRGNILLRAGQLHERAGNRELAMARYSELTRLRAKADPDYQPKLQEARRRLQALRGDG